ncbi:hypothetical protein ZWY2020_054636 [Hordeum vulgare]|nr:hypothetical protein ZWY2020_054636 [Hordeum vulgare]
MRDLLKYCKGRGLLIELGGEAILVIRSERGLARKLATFKSHSLLIRICYARYGDDLLLGIVGAVLLLIEIHKRITHFLQSGLDIWVNSARSTTIVARKVPPRTSPIQFLRELEKRLWVKHRIHITACHLRSTIHSKFRDLGYGIPIKELTKGMSGIGRLEDTVQLAETLGKDELKIPQVSVLWGPGSFSSEFPIHIEAPIKNMHQRLRGRGLICQRRSRPIHVASLTNVSDRDKVNWSAGIALSPLSYYRCCDNLYQVRMIVNYQIRWSTIFALAHKHKSLVRIIILKYPKDSNIVNQEGGKTLAEFQIA